MLTGPSWSSCSGSVGSASHGGYGYPSNTVSGYNGSATFTCNSGNWNYVNGSCNATQRNATQPPPPVCSAVAGPVAWGTCTGYVNAPDTPQGGSYSISATGGGTGSISWSCGAGGSWVETSRTCQTASQPLPSMGCASQRLTWQGGATCSANVPALSNNQPYTVNDYTTWSAPSGSATVICYNGALTITSSYCWNGG